MAVLADPLTVERLTGLLPPPQVPLLDHVARAGVNLALWLWTLGRLVRRVVS